MKQIITTRLMHWKKQWISLVFWLLFPLIATISLTMITDTVQEDSKVPVGIVLEEETAAVKELTEEIKAAPFIRMEVLPEDEALHNLEKHELDSVFIIHEDFEENIQQDNRTRLITGYQSDLSLAYSPVKEMIISYVQQETGRAKAAFTVKQLEQQYNGQENWAYEEIIAKSKSIQQEENLLQTDLSFLETPEAADDTSKLFPVWALWGVFSFLSTLLVFDWVIKEKRSKAILRLAFSRWSLKSYLLQNFMLYMVILFAFDLAAAGAFYVMFNEWISPVNLLVYRILTSMAAFLFANLFKNQFIYYTVSFAFVLVAAIGSGALLPLESAIQSKWFDSINPLAPLLSGEYINIWSVFMLLFAAAWLFRKEKFHA